MNRKKLSGTLALILLLSSFFSGTFVVGATDFPFSVNAVIPENQVAEEHTFFNLLMEPNQYQVLQMTLRNHTMEDIVLLPNIVSATTSGEGVVEYDPTKTPSPTLRHNIVDLVSAVDDEVVIPALGYSVMFLEVQMPVEDFEGVIAGGLVLQARDGEPYTFVMGIILRTDIAEVSPELELTDVFMEAGEEYNTLIATISNIRPRFMNQVTVHTEISRRNEIVHEETRTELQMAPNSRMYYTITSGNELGTGNYTLSINVESGGEVWSWTRGISVGRDGIIEVTYDVSEGTGGIGVVIVIVIIVLVLLALAIVAIRTVMIRQQKAENKKVDEILKSVADTNEDDEIDGHDSILRVQEPPNKNK